LRKREGFLARIMARNVAEPVSAWRAAPENISSRLGDDQPAYLRALLPLLFRGRRLEPANLRRLYQLFAFMNLPAARRFELLAALEQPPAFIPEIVPVFRDRRVRRSLVEEAVVLAANAPSREAARYVDGLRLHLHVRPSTSRKLAQLFERLTDIENRAALILGKRGHVVRFDDRRLELFKKSVAAMAVPSAVLFPLGTIGLSAEGITTGLIALGGGFILPAGIAMVTGLGAAVALGITTKKLLDMMMPTADADRASVNIQRLQAGLLEIERLIDETVAEGGDTASLDNAREKIVGIMQSIAPLNDSQRAHIKAALDHARQLGERYLAFLEHDAAALAEADCACASEVARLHRTDLPAIVQ
jgi:hypothetical protein